MQEDKIEDINVKLYGSITDEAEQKMLIGKSIETAGYALGYGFLLCGLKDKIECDVFVDNQKFKLTFKKYNE